jgi:hypothetical protein
LASSVKKAVAWPPRVPNSVIAKGLKRMSGRLLEFGSYGYTGSLAGPTRGLAVGTKEVKRERWRPAKAPAGPAGRH